MDVHSIGDALAAARQQLNTAVFAPSSREAVLLMSHVLGLDEALVLAHPEHPLDEVQRQRFESLLARRLGGEPAAYLLGEREFYGRAFAVDDRVLIPRPETEHLIEHALALELPEAPRILDIGTGSGSIAITLALELPEATVVAADCSIDALAVAHENRARWGLDRRVHLVAGDLASHLSLADFDLVVSNPPYIAPADEALLSTEITEFEPHVALFAPPDGTAVAKLLLQSLADLRSGSHLLMEIGAGQQDDLLAAAAPTDFRPRDMIADYAGIPRVADFHKR